MAKLNMPVMDMCSSGLPSELAAVSPVDWKPPPAAPTDSLQCSCHSWAPPQLLPPSTWVWQDYYRGTISAQFGILLTISLCWGTSRWPDQDILRPALRSLKYLPSFPGFHFIAIRPASQSENSSPSYLTLLSTFHRYVPPKNSYRSNVNLASSSWRTWIHSLTLKPWP